MTEADDTIIAWIKRGLLKQDKTRPGLAAAIGRDTSAVSRILSGARSVQAREIPVIAAYLGEPPPAGLEPEQAPAPEHPMSGAKPVSMPERGLPVYPSSEAGPEGIMVGYDPIEWIDLPPVLAGVRGAYAMYVVGSSMEPRIHAGDCIYVHPNRPPRKGQLVVCVLRKREDGEHYAFVKELVSATHDLVVLRQANPAKDIPIPRRDVQALHLVVGVAFN